MRASSSFLVGTAWPLNSELRTPTASAGSKWALTDWPTWTASSRSQWALHAGPQPRAPDLSAHCRTSTVSSGSQGLPDPDLNSRHYCRISTASSRFQRESSVGTAGLQPRASDLSGHCMPDLNRELQISVGIAGLQPQAPDLSVLDKMQE